MINLYNETIKDFTKEVGKTVTEPIITSSKFVGNLASAIKGASQKSYYKLGKQYSNFSSAINNITNYQGILKILISNGTILIDSITNLEALGLLDHQMMQNAINNKVFEKRITPQGLETQAIKKITQDFQNRKVIQEIIKKVFAGLGIQKTTAAKAGEAVGGFLGKIANFGNKVKEEMPQKSNIQS